MGTFAFLLYSTIAMTAWSAEPITFECNASQLPKFCNSSLPNSVRIAELLSKMTLDQKVSQVGSNSVPGLKPPLSIPAFEWWGEALHGVCQSPSVHFHTPTPNGTSFPEIIGVGSTFDRALWARMGAAIGLEARVMMNYGNAGGTFWAPNINLVKDPRWGRLQETPGEDPFVTAEYAHNFITGFQGNMSARYLQASSCAKHYAGYSEENWHGDDRYHFNAVISKQDWVDYYSAPFEAAVRGANVSGIMCSYNAITISDSPTLADNTPSCASDWLLTNLARSEWGFDGYITGDCGAAGNVYSTHNFTKTPEEAAAIEIKSGMDIDCGSFVKANLGLALTKGLLTEKDLDGALMHLFSIRMRLGLFDPPELNPYARLTANDIDMKSHQELALLAAEESLTLLENPKHVLPLKPDFYDTVAVIGPNSNNGATMQGVDCHGVPPFLITPAEALKQFSNVTQVDGCGISKPDKSGLAKAVEAARVSSLTVVVVGLDQSTEYEMRDRTSLYLPSVQEDLIRDVCAAASFSNHPCVIVLISGGAIDTTSFKSNENVSAVIWSGYPGQSGGTAIANLIFGVKEPTGRLTQTWYTEDYITNLSMWDMGLQPNISSTVKHGRTHRFFTGKPLYPFGYGLQFAKFALQAPGTTTVPASGVLAGLSKYSRFLAPTLVSASCRVHNIGSRPSATTVLAFLIPPEAGVDGAPLQNLADFARTEEVIPGGSATANMNFTAYDFALVDANGRWHLRAGAWTLRLAGHGSTQPAEMQVLIVNDDFTTDFI